MVWEQFRLPIPPHPLPTHHGSMCVLCRNITKKNFKNLKQNALVLFKETRALDQCRVAVPRPLHTLPTGSGVMKKFWRNTTTNFKIMYFLQQYHNKKHKQKHTKCVNFVLGDKCLEAISCGNPPPPSCPTDRLWFNEGFPWQSNTKPQLLKNALVLFEETGGLGAISFAKSPLAADRPTLVPCVFPAIISHKTQKKN